VLCADVELEAGALLDVVDDDGVALVDELVVEGKLWVVE